MQHILRSSLPLALGVALVAAPVLARAGAAQELVDVCPRGRISEVHVVPKPVFDLADPDLGKRFGWAYRLVNDLHSTTHPEVIRRELLFAEGDCYDPLLLRDSERLLRSSRFISEAEIGGERLPDGTHRVVVTTQDDWSKRIELQTSSRGGFQATGLELREDNLLGTGQQVSAYYRQSLGERVYGVAYATPQLFGSALDAEIAVGRTRDDGYLFSETLAFPFRGDLGRWAFRQHFEHEDRYFQFVKPGDDDLLRILFPERRREMDVGGVFRLGQRGNFSLFGLALAGEWTTYPDGVRFARGGEVGEDLLLLDSAGTGLDSQGSVRLMFLLGQRNVYFVRRRALDAVRGAEDVRLGVEAELGIGRSVRTLSDDDDLALEIGVDAAEEFGNQVIAGGRLTMEAKRDFDQPTAAPEWTNVLGQADAWTYWRAHPRHTVVAAASAAGGWNTTIPFQVTVGSATGLRGYPRYFLPGAQRVAGSLEVRSYLGWPYRRLLDLGSVVFVDAGRTWAGDDPYGVDSGVQTSAGFGLRAAFPPDSRRTYRLDVGFPLSDGYGASGVRVTLGVGQAIGRDAVGTDPQIGRSSRRSVAASLFSYPN